MTRSAARAAVLAAVLSGAVIRFGVLAWTDPWGPHHPDEHILPLEAVALWEGVTPREIGWPASTTRLALSAGLAIRCVAEEGRTLWAERREPARALDNIAEWIGRQYVNPRQLYQVGRMTSIAFATLQLIALAWALRQWVGPVGLAVGMASIAVAPLPVIYSQFVLADIAGMLFATIAVGLTAVATPPRLVGAALLVGAAASSKFHFGIWLLAPFARLWTDPRHDMRGKSLLSVAIVAGTATVIVALVPWFWLNPLLALKEFAGVVLMKVSGGSPLGRVPRNLSILTGGLGALVWAGTVLGAFALRDGAAARRLMPVWLPVAAGAFALLPGSVVFDRYALVLLPGLAILAARGWERALEAVPLRPLVMAALAVCFALTGRALWDAEQRAAEIDVDVLARNWVVANIAPGERVAVHDEMNAFLPRSAEQLRACVEHVDQPRTYAEKLAIEGITPASTLVQPMRSMVLNDEQFAAYWCRRELTVRGNDGFHIVKYHNDARFGSVLELEAIEEFRSRTARRTGGLDVLVVNREVDAGVAPAQILETRRGRRVIYRH